MRLLSTPDRQRFFLLPDDADPGAGSLELQSLLGDAVRADPARVAAYEVPEAVARAWAEEHVAGLVDRGPALQRELESALAALRGQVEEVARQAGLGDPDSILRGLGIDPGAQPPEELLARLAEVAGRLGAATEGFVRGTVELEEVVQELPGGEGGAAGAAGTVQDLLREVEAAGEDEGLRRAAQDLADFLARLDEEEDA